MIFDSHAHYDDERFNEDREDVIKEIRENGVINVLNCGASMEGARDSFKLANKYDFFYAAVGIHPENAYELTEENYEDRKSTRLNSSHANISYAVFCLKKKKKKCKVHKKSLF